MQISEGTVVVIDYALRNDEGTLIDQSHPDQPMAYLHGYRNIIPGLESALEGKVAGDVLEVRVEPSNGYGDTNPALEQVVPMDRFQGIEKIEVGMEFQASTEQGPVSVRIVKIEDDDVTVDGNHPRGKALNFNVTVKEVRAGLRTSSFMGMFIRLVAVAVGACGSEESCETPEHKHSGKSEGSCESSEGCGCSRGSNLRGGPPNYVIELLSGTLWLGLIRPCFPAFKGAYL